MHKWIGKFANHIQSFILIVISIQELKIWFYLCFSFHLRYQLIHVGIDVDMWSMFKCFVVHIFRYFSIHTLNFFRYGVFNREIFQRNALVNIANTNHRFAWDWSDFLVRFSSSQVSSIQNRMYRWLW